MCKYCTYFINEIYVEIFFAGFSNLSCLDVKRQKMEICRFSGNFSLCATVAYGRCSHYTQTTIFLESSLGLFFTFMTLKM